MSGVKILLGVLVVLAALAGIASLLVEDLDRAPAGAAPAGVLFTPPPGFRVETAGELARADAARRLAALLAGAPSEARLGLHFASGGFALDWLADRSDPAAPRLVERSAGPTGTRVETVYEGDLDARLAWAAAHGTLAAPGLPAGAQRNLYH